MPGRRYQEAGELVRRRVEFWSASGYSLECAGHDRNRTVLALGFAKSFQEFHAEMSLNGSGALAGAGLEDVSAASSRANL
ncbi:hypothetical protein D3C71_1193540 [compost metagenome]